MKYKHKRICKSIVSLLLIITFVLAPFEGVFAAFNESSTNETGAGGQLSDENGDGIKPLKNLAVTIGILEIDNTASEYRSQLQAHNLASPDNYWSEYRVSIVDQFLYSHPEKMSQMEEMKNQALILFEQRADKMDGDLTMRDVDWETALEMFYGREKFTFQDSNITVNEAKERVYRATIGIYWMYPDGSDESILVYGVGKFKDDYADSWAYDKVPWIPREDLPNQGHFYSQIRDGNYVEMKDNSPGSGETCGKELKELGNMLDIISIHSYPLRTEKTIDKALDINTKDSLH